ncbi:MAG: DUF3667 domain-containing protein, partial [Arenimonas sp.]
TDATSDSQNTGNVFTKGLRVCGNCGTELLGETCYQCGQPTKGLVRQFSSIMGDFLDTVLNIDTRVFRTIGPLIYKPGYLTQEYFSGRRIRYVSPVRLFFFLAVLTFLLAQFSLPENIGNDNGNDVVQINGKDSDHFSRAKTVEDVEKVRADALAQLDAAKKEMKAVPMAAAGLEQAKSEVNLSADKRIAELKKLPIPVKPVPKALPDGTRIEPDENGMISINGETWDAKKNPIKITWLPDSMNTWFNSLAERAKNNGKRVNKEPKVIIEAVLSSLPMTLFLMLPVFALLLKIMFIFKRRLYMEHLIVALHSHAFLMMAILLLILFNDTEAWLGSSSWLITPINILWVLLWIWMPIYLFLMQKRVYQQGWILTFIKFAFIGLLHIILLSMAIACTLIIKMIWL